MAAWYEPLIERGLIPDFLLRMGIVGQLKERLAEITVPAIESAERNQAFVDGLKTMDIAVATASANEQHYEVDSRFYKLCLGPRLKYSSCLYPDGVTTLADAEEAMLSLYCERAELVDGMKLMDLGCGWGSLSLYLAERFPRSQIVSLSNSATQRQYIEGAAAARGLRNVRVHTGDINEFDFAAGDKGTFDRVLSIEMCEHMKNYQKLFAKIASWLKASGKFFCHIFAHREHAYHFETDDSWMGRYFFTGGQMPAASTFFYFADDLAVQKHWRVDGRHYWQTCEHWLQNMDANAAEIRAIFAEFYGDDDATITKWVNYWRIFFLACAELFRYNDGQEWIVAHYLFTKK
eukprot:Amastigsp_a178909_182.p2 type:complete len:348 gc:universal Amastigsp_a178909_182:1059-16(-)